jgi:hypothetical protein
MKIGIKLQTTWFFGPYIATLPEGQQPAATNALKIYRSVAGRKEFKKVDMGPEFSRVLFAELTDDYGPEAARRIYTEVVDFHAWLVTKGLLKTNPFLIQS